MKNIRYANEVGGILIEQDGGIDLYIDSGDIYDRAVSGEFGAIAPYVVPVKTAEQLAAENNTPILAEIEAIEKKAIRSMRELTLTPSDTVARGFLSDYNSQIKALKARLL